MTPSALERRLPELYAGLALAITLLLCLVTAPFFAPDEANQSLRAITLGHGEWMATVDANDEAGAPADSGMLAAMEQTNHIRMAWEKRGSDFHNRPYGAISLGQTRALDRFRWSHRPIYVPFSNTAVYPPMLYLPAIAGWRAAEALDLTAVRSLHLARLLCALAAVALNWLALRWCACSRWLLLPLLLLPSVLFLNASSSQDALLLPVAALIAAVLSRPLAARRDFTVAELAAMTLLLALAGTARPPNAAMALVLFLPGLELDGKRWRGWVRPAVAFGVVLAVCAGWRTLVAPLGLDNADQADPDLQQAFLRAHPLAALAAVLRGTGDAGADFLRRGLYVLGWNDLLAPAWLSVGLGLALLWLLVTAPAFPLRRWRSRLLLTAAVVVPLLGISLAEYIIWTPPGFWTVYGIQPRYWLPMLPLAILLVKSRTTGTPRPRCLMAAAGVVAAIACTLPWVAAMAFYRGGLGAVLRLGF